MAQPPAARSIVSPPLAEFDHVHLELRLPAYLAITSAPKPSGWLTAETDLTCVCDQSRTNVREVVVQIIRWPRSRAERKGDLTGSPLKTSSGLAGLRNDDRRQDDGTVPCSSAFTILNQRHDTVIFVKVSPKPDVEPGTPACHECRQIASDIFNGLRFAK
jgi:hypothetical protein